LAAIVLGLSVRFDEALVLTTQETWMVLQNLQAKDRSDGPTQERTGTHPSDAPDAAAMNKWTVVDMKNDWKRIFAFEGK